MGGFPLNRPTSFEPELDVEDDDDDDDDDDDVDEREDEDEVEEEEEEVEEEDRGVRPCCTASRLIPCLRHFLKRQY